MLTNTDPCITLPTGAPSFRQTTIRACIREPIDWLRRNKHALVLPVLFVVALVSFSLTSPNFLTPDNQINVARQAVYLLIVALAQLVVLVGGGFDLSVGSVAALASVISATAMQMVYQAGHGSSALAMLAGAGAALVVGGAIGALNGVGVAFLRIPPFMMTLGSSSIAFGLTLLVSGGVPIYGLPPEFGQIFGFGSIGNLPIPVLVAAAVVLAVYVVLEWSRFGRHLYATGGNARAAALSGVRTSRITILAFVIAGALSALAGLLLTARLDTGESNIGATLPLESIAACVIAGVALTGGVGRTLLVAAGTVFIVMVQNGLNLLQVGAYAQTMIVGGVLIFAMAFSKR